MKKLFLGLIATVMFCFVGNAQSKREIAISKLYKVSMVSLVDNSRLYYKDGMLYKQFATTVSGNTTLSKEENLVLTDVYNFLVKKSDAGLIYETYDGASIKALANLPITETVVASRCGWICWLEIIKGVIEVIIDVIIP